MERKTIGIDLGHCETTAAYPRQTQSDRYEVRRLNVMDKEQVISTQIILTDKQMRKLSGHNRPDYALLRGLGEIRIGNKLPAYVAEGEKFSYFKAAPKDFDVPYGSGVCAKECGITHGMLMACFAFALVNNLLKFNVGDVSEAERENVDLLIGCPTTGDWTDKGAQAAYSGLVQNATNVHGVRIIPESRAAMFSSVENEQEKISALKGAIVFDFGSSTADCTYMLLGRKIIEFSWSLGASEIERQMVRTAYKEAIRLNGPFSASTASIVENEDLLRAAKEEYYNGLYGLKGHPMFCSFENAANGSMVDTPIRINSQYMEVVTGANPIQIWCDSKTTVSNSWKDLCRAFFQEARRRLSAASYCVAEDGKQKRIPCGVESIVLTGGASKMAFIYDLCQEVFPDAQIHKEANPSHTVSNGLAWVAVSDENFAACKEAAQKELDAKSDCSVEILRNRISNALFDGIVEIAENRTQNWANQPEEKLPVRVLQDDLTAYISSPEVQTAMGDICRGEIEEWKNGLSTAMEEAVNNQVKRLYSEQVARNLVIPSDIWQELQASTLPVAQIDVGESIKGIDLSGVLLKIGKFVVQAVIWAAAWALAAETLFISLAVALVVDMIADSVMTDKDLDKPRDKNTRTAVAKKVRSKFTESKADIMKDFCKDLEQQTATYSNILDNTLSTALEIVTLKRFGVEEENA